MEGEALIDGLRETDRDYGPLKCNRNPAQPKSCAPASSLDKNAVLP
jgi:hypothetical protein